MVVIDRESSREIEAPPGWQAINPIKTMIGREGTQILVTRRSGLFTLEISETSLSVTPLWPSLPAPLESVEVASAATLDDGGFILGTKTGEILRIESDGNTLWDMTALNGFHAGEIRSIVPINSNTALAFFDGGASFVDTRSDVRVWDIRSGLTSPPHDLAIYGTVTFMATQAGLFRSLSSHRMRLVPEAGTAPIAGITKFPRSNMRGHFSLLIARESGLFDFFNGDLSEILSERVSVVHIAKTRPSRVIAASGASLIVLNFVDGSWEELGRIETPSDAPVSDIAEGPEGNLFSVTADGQVILYGPESWLADTVEADATPLIQQTIPRRLVPESTPFLTAFGDQVRAFIHGAPLLWDARRSAFISDIQLTTWASEFPSDSSPHW